LSSLCRNYKIIVIRRRLALTPKLQMSSSTENIRLWMAQSEPDYYLYFLKVWIPFNAWYVAEYPALNKKDTDIIKALQDQSDSKPRKIIKNFLDHTSGHDALKFQEYFAELHFQLDKISINHNGKRLSFRNLSLTENPVKFATYSDSDGNVYKVEKTSTYYQAYIQAKGGKVRLDFKKPDHNLFDLTKDNDYIRLDKKLQTKITNLFEDIDPKKAISIISESTQKKDYKSLKSKNPCRIISDTETVSKACINVLYALRCMLFHGEIAPTETNKKIYENAFYLLLLIINELK
jgi:hypothetical protein